MADNRKDDGLFHWNFDLKESDSDFTDIDYTPRSAVSSANDPDIDPSDRLNIFVPVTENAPKRVQPVSQPQNSSAPKKEETILLDLGATKRLQPVGRSTGVQTKAAVQQTAAQPKTSKAAASLKSAKKPAAGRSTKKESSYISKKAMKKYLPIAAAVLVVVLLICLVVKLWPKKKAGNQWVQASEGSEIVTLVKNYYKAKQEGSASAMRGVLDTSAKVNAQTLEIESKIYESYEDIKVYQIKGIKDGEYCLCTTVTEKFRDIDTKFSSMAWLYALPGANGKLRLMTSNEYGNEGDIYDRLCAVSDCDELIKSVLKDVETNYNTALTSDAKLAAFVESLYNGTYVIPGEPTTEAPTDPQPGQTGGEYCAYISADSVRFRSAPNTTTSEVLGYLNKGYYVYVVGMSGDFYHIQDIMNKNDATGQNQAPSGYEGYVYKDYVVTNYSAIN